MKRNQVRKISEKIRQEYNNFVSNIPPLPQIDWDLIWVLTGQNVTLEEVDNHGNNETKNRLETGIKLAKKVVALRKGKSITDVDIKDIDTLSPLIYISGYDSHNIYFRKLVKQGVFIDRYNFSNRKIIVGPNEGILHTGHQFEYFPNEFIIQNRRIVLVTDTYHLPRVIRYTKKEQYARLCKKLVLYPSFPISTRQDLIDMEIRKIIDYIDKGILANE